MGCEEESRRGGGGGGGWNLTAKPCDSCKSASALLFCRADSAFLCINCDSKIHSANKLASRHERVWMCEVCEQEPASVTCKADAAALCVTCDRDIHSANPLARRHERFPVVPFFESVSVKSNSAATSSAVNFLVPDASDVVDGGGFMKPIEKEDQDQEDEADEDQDQDQDLDDESTREEEAEAASWLLQNPNPKLMEAPDLKTGDYFFSDVDPYLDLDYSTAPITAKFHHHHNHHHGSGTDSVVPVQNEQHLHLPPLIPSSDATCIDLDFTRSKPNYSYNNTSPLSQSVSSCSLEVGVVPEANCDISNSSFMINNLKNGIEHLNGLNSSIGLNNNNQVPPVACQLSGLDREARVLRYREKRKNRKFEKTIRYASRKAYAETRPRIKGRFAKRTEIESEVDRIYSSAAALMVDSGYGIVPSF